ncbi:MAG: hypothetical protein NTU73_00195 [Ignavibacteriae bacterium]|nr:hypothetical protein [Ignavibacteriota bacterium]
MKSYCFEIKTTCKNCGNPISINAFVNEIFCESCNGKNIFTQKLWKSIVMENINEAEDFQDGEGQNSKTFTGEYEFSLLFGKQKARCSKCKTTIPEDVLESFNKDNYTCPQCNNNISVRIPDKFISQIVPAAKLIVGEDANQFKTEITEFKKPEDIKPVIFTCPACAANLEVDGSKRMINCKFCDSKVYLPDDLWHELHPVKTVNRWYVVLDETGVNTNILPEWYHLSDVAADNDGNIYLATADSENEDFRLWSINPELKLRWIRNDIKYDHENAGITITKDNKILLWNLQKRSLNIYSCADGKDIKIIKGADASQENPYPFTLKGCTTLLSDSDNTILAVVNNTFVRFYEDGSRAPVWKVVSQEGEKPGFFSRLFGGGNTEIKIPSDDSEWTPCVKEIGSKPKRVDGDFTKINLGYDGFVYLLDKSSSDGVLAKYTRDGEQLWKKHIPLSEKDCKPFADKNGNVYVLGKDENDKTKLIRFSDDGKQIDLLQNDVLDGGLLSTEDTLALSPDGTIYTFRYYGVLKIFAPDLTLKFVSDRAKEEDEEKIKNNRKKKEAEE